MPSPRSLLGEVPPSWIKQPSHCSQFLDLYGDINSITWCPAADLFPLLVFVHSLVISNLITHFVCSLQIFIIFNLYCKSFHLCLRQIWYFIPLPLIQLCWWCFCCTSQSPCCLTLDLLFWSHSTEVLFFWLSLEPLPSLHFTWCKNEYVASVGGGLAYLSGLSQVDAGNTPGTKQTQI